MQVKGKTLILLPAEAAALAEWLRRQAGPGLVNQYIDPPLVRALGDCLAQGHSIRVVPARKP